MCVSAALVSAAKVMRCIQCSVVVLVTVVTYSYAGPGSQAVRKTFPLGGSISNWLVYLQSTHKIAIASLDGRGTAAAGDKLKFEIYRKLSTVEVEDQIIAGRCVSLLIL